jgi:predicted nucleotidyltransferase
MPESTPRFLDLLRALSDAGVEYVIVGGVAAVLLGAPVSTFDLDIVHRRDADNLNRLLKVLESLDAHYRGRPGPPLYPDLEHLASAGHQLLSSRLGPIDVLGTIDGGRDYDDLVEHVVTLELDELRVRVLDLETLIGIKERIGRPKDQAVLPVLREALAQSKTKS